MDPSSVKLVAEQLARLHAASHHYLDHFPDGGLDGFKRAHPLFINDRWLFSKSAGERLNRISAELSSEVENSVSLHQGHCWLRLEAGLFNKPIHAI